MMKEKIKKTDWVRWVFYCPLVCLFMFCTYRTTAQIEEAQHKIFGGPGFEEARDAIPLPDGGYAVVGTTSSTPGGDADFFLMKLDAEMNCVWTNRYGSPGVENARALSIDTDGNFLLCGFTNSPLENAYDVLVIKTDSEGNELWRLNNGGEDWDFGYDIAVDPDGKIVVCGNTYSDTVGSSDGFLLVISPDGEMEQYKKIGYAGYDTFNSLVLFGGKVFVAGATDHFSTSALSEAWIMGFDDTLQNLWEFHIAGGESELYSVKTGMQGIIASGYHKTGTYKDALVITSDVNGITQVLVDGENINSDYPIRDACVWSEGFMIGGSQQAYGAGANDIMLQQRTLSGDWVIGHTLGFSDDDKMYAMNITADQQVIVAGVTYSYSETSGAQAYIIHLSNVVLGTFYTNTLSEENCIDFTNEITDIQPLLTSIFVKEGNLVCVSDKYEKIAVSIIDMTGRECMKTSVMSGESTNISDLSSGLYIVYAQFDSGIKTLKFQHSQQAGH